jgi:hypothetical protein
MGRQALVVWGGWDGHTPKQCAQLCVDDLKHDGYEVACSDSLDAYLDESLMQRVDLIVPIWTMGQITDDQWQALNRTVRGGTGLAGFHGGIIDAFRNNTEYQWMTGGQWVAHPGNCIPRYTVQVVDSEHPITQGIEDFELRGTEQYYVHVDPGNHVLCRTVFTGEHGESECYPAGVSIPYAWTRQWGAGRVFVACWGHTYKDFDVPPAWEIVRRGMRWACR